MIQNPKLQATTGLAGVPVSQDRQRRLRLASGGKGFVAPWDDPTSISDDGDPLVAVGKRPSVPTPPVSRTALSPRISPRLATSRVEAMTQEEPRRPPPPLATSKPAADAKAKAEPLSESEQIRPRSRSAASARGIVNSSAPADKEDTTPRR